MFPGYEFKNGKSTYRGMDVSEGGQVYSKPGMYIDVALLDIESQHPTSLEEMNMFGPYTKRFSDIKNARLAIKHEEYDKIRNMLDGQLAEFLDDKTFSLEDLSSGLKTVINSVYGLTSAKFENAFKDPRNIDNIVAKRGALFMIDLKYAVEEEGFIVAHIKTDSIKIPNANQYIIDFVKKFGKKYGYNFEHEATYSKICLVNNAVYIAKYDDMGIRNKKGKHAGEWTATGSQFAQPYVFKTLFSKEPIVFEDLCETNAVTTSLYLDMNEKSPEEHQYHFIGKIGLFCPIKPGCGGGLLMREKEGKYYYTNGSKGYRWMESEMVKTLKKEDDIDRSYYNSLVDDSVKNISKYGDFEWFVNGKTKEIDNPPWVMECGKYEYCTDCPNWITNKGTPNTCKLGYDCIPF